MSNRPSFHGASGVGIFARGVRGSLTALVALVMFAMMMLTTIDVAGRFLLNAPVKGSDELVSFLLATLIFASLPLITWDERHITVRLFDRWIIGRLHRVLDVLLSATSTIVLAVVTYRMWIQGVLMSEGQHITGALEWPIAPIAYLMSVLSGLTTLILVGLTWQKSVGAFNPYSVDIESERVGAD
ncbi:MAG TPA: TRAP transporter small permease [Xanthobacteraceae bacterium]|jgi:TRAP-type C4-dicarboxylate transport system permease small subunit